MARGRARWRRGLALWVVVVSLLAPGGVSAGIGCGVCPSDCPMHRVVDQDEAHDMPCHRVRTTNGETDGYAVRAACGHRDALDFGVQVRQRDVATCRLARPSVSRAVQVASARLPDGPTLDVPTRPPQHVRAA